MMAVHHQQNFYNSNQKCKCCPYGYHMDLDFVRYCEQLANTNQKLTQDQVLRRNRRREAKSMEFLLGIDTLDSYNHHQHMNTNDIDAENFLGDKTLDEVCNDFDKIFEKSNQKNVKRNDLKIEKKNLNNEVQSSSPVNSKTQTSSPASKSQTTNETLQTIRDQMALSLRHTKDLEEQNKLIPLLQVCFFILY